MLNLLKAAAYAQLASHFALPADLQKKVSDFARNQETEKAIVFLQDQTIAGQLTRSEIQRIDQAVRAMREVTKGIQGPEDASTLIANYEAIAKKPFQKPAWMSMEMNKLGF